MGGAMAPRGMERPEVQGTGGAMAPRRMERPKAQGMGGVMASRRMEKPEVQGTGGAMAPRRMERPEVQGTGGADGLGEASPLMPWVSPGTQPTCPWLCRPPFASCQLGGGCCGWGTDGGSAGSTPALLSSCPHLFDFPRCCSHPAGPLVPSTPSYFPDSGPSAAGGCISRDQC